MNVRDVTTSPRFHILAAFILFGSLMIYLMDRRPAPMPYEKTGYERAIVLSAVNSQSTHRLSMRMRVQTATRLFLVSTGNPLLFATEGNQVCVAVFESVEATAQRASLVGGNACANKPRLISE